MNIGDSILTVGIYAAGLVLIAGLPIALVVFLVKTPADHILKSIADYKYRIIDNEVRAVHEIPLPNGDLIVRRYVGGEVQYKKYRASQITTASAPGTVQAVKEANDAARWIVASYATTKCSVTGHKHGPDGKQLLTQDECIEMAVMGSPREWQAARDWLKDQWMITIVSGSNAGTYTDKPLSEMLDHLTALPKRGRP